MWVVSASQIEAAGKGRVRAGFTWRIGNLGLHIGDDPADVVSRRMEVAGEFSGALSDWICGEQVHEDRVTLVGQTDKGAGSTDYTSSIRRSDSLITSDAGITLATLAADCVPCLFYDDRNQVIAVAHAGWRGTVQNLPVQTVTKMQLKFGTQLQHLWIALGPAIGECCYEVDTPIYTEFQNRLPEAISKFRQTDDNHYQVDLRGIIEQSLQQYGVLNGHLERVGGCTSCENQLWFSHRKEKGAAGRHAGLIRIVQAGNFSSITN
ncbi:MAG: hypothetical protein JWN30_1198 [Bacilli bacterium]|nr:hypothetical protein [Bacilli bacterium]